MKLIGLLCLAWLVLSRVDVDGISSSWRGITPGRVALLALLFSLSLGVRIAKWGWQAKSVGFTFTPLALTRSYIEGLLVGLVTPLRVGELYRLAVLEVPKDAPPHLQDPLSRGSLGAASLLLEKGYELAVICGMVTLGCLFSFDLPGVALGVGALTLGFFAFGLLPIGMPSFAQALFPQRIWERVLAPMFRARDDLPMAVRLGLVGSTLLAQMINLTGGVIVFNLFGDVSAATYILRMPAITLVNLVPITVAGVGLRELGSMEIFGPIGFDPSAAAAAASLLFISIQLVPLCLLLPLHILKALGYETPPESP